MGVEWGAERIVIKPFNGTRTLRNLRATGAAVVNLTDDILLFSQAALGDPQPADPSGVQRRGRGAGRRLLVARGARGGDRRGELRARVSTVVVGGGSGREFLGLNRARHAVLEASILASRAHLLPAEEIRAELGRLQVLVDKRQDHASARRWTYVRARGRSSMIRVEAPARLHLGMLAVAGDGVRRFGGLGVSVSRPAVVLEAEPADALSAEGADAERALTFARRFHDGAGARRAARTCAWWRRSRRTSVSGRARSWRSRWHRRWPRCTGGRSMRRALAEAVGRAARSAVGTWTFALGGLVVEGGVRRGEERPAPLLARHAMPEEWRVVLVVPSAEPGLSGAAEVEAFGRLVPSAERSATIAQLVLTSLLPALVERDLEEFGAALTRIQQLVGDSFATVQGGRFHPRADALVDALLGGGAAGAGQSSWGPAVYGVVGSEAAGRELARRMEAVMDGEGSVQVVTFDNRGARLVPS